jgi:hypothetical protein
VYERDVAFTLVRNEGGMAMTEQEWKECTDIEKMLACLVERRFPDAEPSDWKQGERKKRLFLRACLNRIWPLLPAEFRAVFELLEPEGDSQISRETRRAMCSAAEGVSSDHDNLLFALGYDDIGLLCHFAAGMAAKVGTDEGIPYQDKGSRRQQEHREQASLLREIFGNPFRPVRVDSAWLTPTVVGLARMIYDDRAFDRVPQLADALEGAGCHDTAILGHCRLPGPHVRGCWVVDAILGKK